MKRTPTIILCLAIALVFAGGLQAAEETPTLEEALKAVKTFEQGDSHRPVYAVRDAVYASTDNESERAAMEKRLLGLLKAPQSTYRCRKLVCHDWLPVIGGERSVPVLADMLDGQRQSMLAIEALQQIPVPEAEAALREAVQSTSGEAKVMAVKALGARRDAKAVDLLSGLLKKAEGRLREETLLAIASIGTGDAAKILLQKVDPMDPGAAEALQTLAQRRLEEKAPRDVERAAELLLKEDQPLHVRRTGLSAVAQLGPERALPHLASAIRSPARALAGHALNLTLKQHRDDSVSAIGKVLSDVSDERKALVLHYVGLYGNESYARIVVPMTEGQPDEVRAAAIRALGHVGSSSQVDALLELAAGETGSVQQAAREALAMIDAEPASRAIVSRMKEGQPQVRAEAIRAAVSRQVSGVKDRLAQLAAGGNEAVRLAAYRGFEEVCGGGDAQVALQLLLKAGGDTERSVATQALRKALSATKQRAGVVKRIVKELDSGDPDTVTALLKVTPEFPTDAALKSVKSLLNSGNADVREAALRSLAEWSGVNASEALMEIVRNSDTQKHRTLALRGLINTLPDASNPAAVLRKIRPHVKRVAEKRLLLSAASNTDPSSELLSEIVPMLSDRSVAAEAAAAVVNLAKEASYVNPELLRKAVDTIKSAGLQDKLQKQVQQIQKRAKELEQSVQKSMNQIESVSPNGFRRVAYLNCGADRRVSGGGVTISQLTGQSHTYGGQPITLQTVAFHDNSLEYEITGLSSDKDYMLGIAWWDVDRNGRVQSVSFGSGEPVEWTEVVPPSPVKANYRGKPTWARMVLPVQSRFAENGRMRVAFRKHGQSNVTISELWLLERAGSKPERRIAIVTGDDIAGHPWRQVSTQVAGILRQDDRLQVSIQETPYLFASPLLDYWDATVLCFQNDHMETGPGIWSGLRNHVEGGAGLVLVHFACGAFQEWEDFVKIAGRVWNPDLRAHDPHGEFEVNIKDTDHLITAGLSDFRTVDELYTCLDGDTPINLLATATSKVDKKEYPMAFTNRFGKGHVFHCTLGHDLRAFKADEVGRLYLRGLAWTLGLEPK